MLKGAEHFKLALSPEQINQLELYKDLLIEANKSFNLTAITDPDEIRIKHFLDSIIIFKFADFHSGQKVIDIGTGAGFPGIPIKIYNPGLKLVLMDSLRKRVNFLENIKEKLQLEDVENIHGRAEEFGHKDIYREEFDFALSRAVAKLSTLAEYCLPFVKKGGYFVSYKGPNIEEELNNAGKAISLLGGRLEKIEKVSFPKDGSIRNLIFIKKISATPEKYPRKPGMPDKKPIS